MRYALIGCGRISPNHIEAAKNNKLDFVAICDILPEAMQDKAGRFGLEGVKQYTDYRQMLKAEQPELVAIATESGRHAQIALDCIDAGCSVIIEKPIALSLADADEIIKRSKERVCRYVQIIKTASTDLYRKYTMLLKRGALEGYFTQRRIFAGTGAGATMSKPLGGEHGRRTAAHL